MPKRSKPFEQKTSGLGALLDEAEGGQEKSKKRLRKGDDVDLNFDAAFDRR